VTQGTKQGEVCQSCKRHKSAHVPDLGKLACPVQEMDERVPIRYFVEDSMSGEEAGKAQGWPTRELFEQEKAAFEAALLRYEAMCNIAGRMKDDGTSAFNFGWHAHEAYAASLKGAEPYEICANNHDLHVAWNTEQHMWEAACSVCWDVYLLVPDGTMQFVRHRAESPQVAIPRTKDHQEWLVEKLTDPARAAAYVDAARDDSPEMLAESLQDVAKAQVASPERDK
jgi:hypothetical protein